MELIRLLRALWWGIFLEYHLRKRNRVSGSFVKQYHQEMGRYYYKKAYGEEYDADE